MKNENKRRWIRSSEMLPDASIAFKGKDISVRVLVWHKPTGMPFVGEFVRADSGAEYFTDGDLWSIEIEHCPFWMHIPALPKEL